MSYNVTLLANLNYGTIEWKEIIAIIAATISLFAFFISCLSYKIARRNASSEIEVYSVHEGFDSRNMKNNVGRLVYYWTINMSNHGGRTATFRGILCGGLRRWAVGICEGKLTEVTIPAFIYVFEKPVFYRLVEDHNVLSEAKTLSPEELATLNISLPSGETKSLSFALVIDNDNPKVEGYVLSLKMAFNRGKDHDLSKALSLSGQPVGSQNLS